MSYNSHTWKRLRVQLLREQPICIRCLNMGVVTPATVIDHCIPAKAYDDFFDSNNLFQICHTCHNQVTATFDNKNMHEIFTTDYNLIKYSGKEFRRAEDGFYIDEDLNKLLIDAERVGRGVSIPPIVD